MNHSLENIKVGFFQANDSTKLRYWFYRADQPKGTIILLHGHGEHSGRYKKFVTYLKDSNLNVATYDFRGHGESEGPHVYIESYENYIEDVSAFVKFLEKEEQLEEKFILFGHSNGGLTAVHWAMRHKDRLQGLILSAPFLGLKLPWILKALNGVLNQCVPRFVYKNPIYPPYLTHNLEELEKYKADPYIRRKISVRLLAEMLTYIEKLQHAPAPNFDFPCFILMSGEERVVDPDRTKDFYDRLNCPEKDLTEFQGLYHEIFNERGQERVFEKFIEYLGRI